MDYDKLIERLRWWAEQCDRTNHGCQARHILSDAATAIETIRAENERLRADKNKAIESLSKIVKLTHEQRDTAIADLARVTAERDAAKSADVAPVVHCREYKHFNLVTHECENECLSTDHEGGASYSLNFCDDDFCSYGERKEANT